jgi:hypothetical protein
VRAQAAVELAETSGYGTKQTNAFSQCPLLGVKRTSRFNDVMSAFDPKRTSDLCPRNGPVEVDEQWLSWTSGASGRPVVALAPNICR